MKRSIPVLFAWSLSAAIALMAGIGMVNGFLVEGAADQSLAVLAGNLLWAVLPVEFAFLAAVIIARQPRNLIGWLLLGPALALANDGGFNAYFGGFSAPPAAPSFGFLAVLWFYTWSWLLLVFPVFLLLQLFPSGQPVSAGWRRAAQYVLAVGVIFFLIIAFGQKLTPQQLDWAVDNPVGFISTAWIERYGMPLLSIGLISSTLLSGASMMVRYRRAVALERAQIRWLLYAGVLFVLIYMVSIFGNLQTSSWGLGSGLLYFLAPLTFMTMPAAIGIAILRYRLWDIDILIRRTLVYAVLSGFLALVYLGAVTVLQSVFTSISGQSSAAAVVLSTLAIAALFAPLRTRVQDFIDRRFYRQKVDAEQALTAFAAVASRETDLSHLSNHLTSAVQETLQPQEVSLWMITKGIKR